MALKLIFVLLLLVIISENSCKDNGVGPGNSDYGRRDYTWEIDTIRTQDPLTLTRIWGISPTDVWAVGSGATSAIDIWHYDGKYWRCDSVARFFTPWAVIGFSSNEVWLGNSSSSIWRYNGYQWQQFGNYSIEGFKQVVIQNFDGLSSDDIYGVGFAESTNGVDYKGIIIHYDGEKWSFVNIPPIEVGFADGKIEQESNTLLLEGTDYATTGWVNKVHAWDGNQLKEIYSGGPYASVGNIQHEVLITINQKIYKYTDGQLVLWKNLTGSEYSGKVWCGRNENDFFIASANGMGHFNGQDFKTLFRTNLTINGGYIFDKDVFFIYADNNKVGINIVVHGILK